MDAMGLDVPRNSGDRVALAVDNPGACCCQGRMARFKPLTLEWFKGVMQPRYSEAGEVTYVLTPPRRRGTPQGRVLGVCITCLVFAGLIAYVGWSVWGGRP